MGVLVVILNPDGNEGCYVDLSKRDYLIGRVEGADIELDSSAVSRRHAKVERIAQEWYVEDLGSRNGTSVNGQRVRRVRLEEGDLVGTGDVFFFFTNSPADELGDFAQNFPRLREMALKYNEQIVRNQKPLEAPSEAIPIVKRGNSFFKSGKHPTLLSDIASGKIKA